MATDRIKTHERSPDRGRTEQNSPAPMSRKTSRSQLDLQNAMGNKTVNRLLQGSSPVSQPNDPRYRRRPVHEQSVQFKRVTTCKRQDCHGKRRGERDFPKAQHRAASVQAQDERHWNTEAQGAESVLNALGTGEPIPIPIAELFSAAYQSDLSDVRLHRNSMAAADHNAEALTIGRHVAFAPGQYQPGTQKGSELIGHELAHVVQQSGGTNGVQRAGGRPSGLHESEADAAAAAAMSGGPAPSLSPVLAYAGSVQLEQGTAATPTQTEDQSSAEPQGESEPESEPAVQEERTLSPSAVVTRVDRIIGALQGVTWGNDSRTIRNTVTGLTGPSLRAVMVEFRNRGSQHGKSGDGMVEWMLNDLTSDDARAVETHIIRECGLPDTRTWVAARILDCLQGFTSVSTGSDSAEIRRYLEFFTGSDLDGVLLSLQTQAGKTQQEMAGWLFGDIGRLDAQRVAEHFGRSGGLRCYDYLAWWRANNIYDLLAGATSRADSGNILRNFESTPVDLRRLVMQQLDGMTRNTWGQPAEQALMEDMRQEDYESLLALERVDLGSYTSPGFWAQAGEYLEWGPILASWWGCGLLGLATGLLQAIWELVVMLWDVAKAAYHLVAGALYLRSGGAVGRGSAQAIEGFFASLGEFFDRPSDALSTWWNDLADEFHTIEGPLTDCRRAEFIVRRVVVGLVNIVLVFVGGYGIAKGVASGIKGLATLAGAVRAGQGLHVAIQAGTRVATAGRNFVAVSVAAATRVGQALRHPIRSLLQARKSINTVLLATRNVETWAWLRGRAGRIVEGEAEYWREWRRFWRERAWRQERQHTALSEEAAALEAGAAEQQAPPNAEQVVDDLGRQAQALENDAAALEVEVLGESAGARTPVAAGATTATPPIEMVEIRVGGSVHRIPRQGGQQPPGGNLPGTPSTPALPPPRPIVRFPLSTPRDRRVAQIISDTLNRLLVENPPSSKLAHLFERAAVGVFSHQDGSLTIAFSGARPVRLQELLRFSLDDISARIEFVSEARPTLVLEAPPNARASYGCAEVRLSATENLAPVEGMTVVRMSEAHREISQFVVSLITGEMRPCPSCALNVQLIMNDARIGTIFRALIE